MLREILIPVRYLRGVPVQELSAVLERKKIRLIILLDDPIDPLIQNLPAAHIQPIAISSAPNAQDALRIARVIRESEAEYWAPHATMARFLRQAELISGKRVTATCFFEQADPDLLLSLLDECPDPPKQSLPVEAPKAVVSDSPVKKPETPAVLPVVHGSLAYANQFIEDFRSHILLLNRLDYTGKYTLIATYLEDIEIKIAYCHLGVCSKPSPHFVVLKPGETPERMPYIRLNPADHQALRESLDAVIRTHPVFSRFADRPFLTKAEIEDVRQQPVVVPDQRLIEKSLLNDTLLDPGKTPVTPALADPLLPFSKQCLWRRFQSIDQATMEVCTVTDMHAKTKFANLLKTVSQILEMTEKRFTQRLLTVHWRMQAYVKSGEASFEMRRRLFTMSGELNSRREKAYVNFVAAVLGSRVQYNNTMQALRDCFKQRQLGGHMHENTSRPVQTRGKMEILGNRVLPYNATAFWGPSDKIPGLSFFCEEVSSAA